MVYIVHVVANCARSMRIAARVSSVTIKPPINDNSTVSRESAAQATKGKRVERKSTHVRVLVLRVAQERTGPVGRENPTGETFATR